MAPPNRRLHICWCDGSVGIIWLGGVIFPDSDLKLVDPLVAIGVALLIFKAAYKLTVESGRGLMDVSPHQMRRRRFASA